MAFAFLHQKFMIKKSPPKPQLPFVCFKYEMRYADMHREMGLCLSMKERERKRLKNNPQKKATLANFSLFCGSTTRSFFASARKAFERMFCAICIRVEMGMRASEWR
jgi:hypothetical protein